MYWPPAIARLRQAMWACRPLGHPARIRDLRLRRRPSAGAGIRSVKTGRDGARTAGVAALGAAGLAVSAHVASYGLWRRRCLTWGATTSEADATLSGDDLLPEPDIVATRAIGIGAPVDHVWPWLVQMGPGRAGAYTYDWIENLLGLNMHSADVIIPELQQLSIGETWQLGSRGPVLRVALLEPKRALAVRSDDGNWAWAFVLEPGQRATRLISRNRIAMAGAPWLQGAFARYVMEPGSLIMERKMLLGIKARAEHLTASGDPVVGP